MPPFVASLSRLHEIDVHETPLVVPPYRMVRSSGALSVATLRDFHARHAARLWWVARACERLLNGKPLAAEVLEIISELAHERGPRPDFSSGGGGIECCWGLADPICG